MLTAQAQAQCRRRIRQSLRSSISTATATSTPPTTIIGTTSTTTANIPTNNTPEEEIQVQVQVQTNSIVDVSQRRFLSSINHSNSTSTATSNSKHTSQQLKLHRNLHHPTKSTKTVDTKKGKVHAHAHAQYVSFQQTSIIRDASSLAAAASDSDSDINAPTNIIYETMSSSSSSTTTTTTTTTRNSTNNSINPTSPYSSKPLTTQTISMQELQDLASQTCTPLSLSNMYKYASANANSINYSSQRLRNAQFLHRELPIRIAQRAVDLLTLPHGLNQTAQVQDICNIYLRYLHTLKNTPCPRNEEEELAFTEVLTQMVLDRKSIPRAISEGVSKVRDFRQESSGNGRMVVDAQDTQRLEEMEKALYRFFSARTGLRLLTEHHILSCKHRAAKENQNLRKVQSTMDGSTYKYSVSKDELKLNGDGNENENGEGREEDSVSSGSTSTSSSSLSATFDDIMEDESYLGCIKANCQPADEARTVAKQVMSHCKECYGITPNIEILDCTPDQFQDLDFTYVPHHLQYMMTELLKNSCRATIRRYMEGNVSTEEKTKEGGVVDDTIPPVRVVIVKGAEDVTIKIADKGGGVPRSIMHRLWTFAHRGDSGKELETSNGDENDSEMSTSMDGFTGGNFRGFGLPLSRIYARYFGGELTLKSMEGYGVDAYLYLPVLGVACENLPQRVLLSPANHDSIHDGNYHIYQGDPLNLGGEEAWGNGGLSRQFSTQAYQKLTKNAL